MIATKNFARSVQGDLHARIHYFHINCSPQDSFMTYYPLWEIKSPRNDLLDSDAVKNRLLDSFFDDILFIRKSQLEKLLVKNCKHFFSSKKFRFSWNVELLGPVTGICTEDDKFFMGQFLVQ